MRVLFVFAGILKYKGRLLKQISTMQQMGHECILIHGQVEDSIPDYSCYPFKVIRIKLDRHHNKIVNFHNLMRFNFSAAKTITKQAADAVVSVELYGALSGALARHRNPEILFVFDCNELFMHMGMSRMKKLMWAPIHSWVFRKADVVIHAEEQRLLFCQGNYRSKAKHFLLENLPVLNGSHTHGNKTLHKPLRTVYIGALLPKRYCSELINAFAKIPPEIASCDLIGFGEPEYENQLIALVNDLKLWHVRILPPVNHDQMLETLKEYDIGIAFYENLNLNQYYCAPNKIYDYIACALPIISNDYPGLRKVIEERKIGVCLAEINEETLMSALELIETERMIDNITESVRHRYSWQNQTAAYSGIFSEALQSERTS